jgi:phthalate 4,5-cis-dihydrodiol dehydrogenase
VTVVACSDPDEEKRLRFAKAFGAMPEERLEAVLEYGSVEAVYLATPSNMHYEHILICLAAGKHVMVEKPLALTLTECDEIVRLCQTRPRQWVLVGYTHSFDPAVIALREMAGTQVLGKVRFIEATRYSNYARRPRRGEERAIANIDIFSNQMPHQIEMVRAIQGSDVIERVYASAVPRHSERPYGFAAVVDFEGGVAAATVYDGSGHFNSDAWFGGIDTLGIPRDPTLSSVFQPHFGSLSVILDGGIAQTSPLGLDIYENGRRRAVHLPLPEGGARGGMLDTLVRAVRWNEPPLQDSIWAANTVAICVAARTSAREGRAICPVHWS